MDGKQTKLSIDFIRSFKIHISLSFIIIRCVMLRFLCLKDNYDNRHVSAWHSERYNSLDVYPRLRLPRVFRNSPFVLLFTIQHVKISRRTLRSYAYRLLSWFCLSPLSHLVINKPDIADN